MKERTGRKAVVTREVDSAGPRLCERLLAEDSGVLGPDNFLTWPRADAAHLLEDPYLWQARAGVTEQIHTADQVDVGLQVALPPSSIDYLLPSIDTMMVGSIGLLCELSKKKEAHDAWAIPTFVGQAINIELIPAVGDGVQTHSECSVDDLVEGISRMLHFDPDGRINIGKLHELTVLQLGKRICDLPGSMSEIAFIPRPEIRCPDVTIAQKEHSWSPQMPIEENLKRNITWLGEHPGLVEIGEDEERVRANCDGSAIA